MKKSPQPSDHAELMVLRYSVVISLNSPETHPTWLPIFTACQPLKALATYSSVVPVRQR